MTIGQRFFVLGTIYKRGRYWYIDLRVKGRRIRKKVGPSKKIAKEAGIKDLTTLHALRHTFASQLVMKGVDLPTVQKLMGHSDIQTTMIYSHLSPDHLADVVDKLPFSA